MQTDHDVRASDAERNAYADLLRRHHAEGRLDTDELEERLERCYAAKTRGQLDALTTDLPRRQLATRHRRGPIPRPLACLVAIAAIVTVSMATGAHVIWLVWALAFFLFGPFGRHARWRRVP